MTRSRRTPRALTLKAMPLRQFAGRATLVFVAVLAMTLTVMSRNNSTLTAGMRATVSDVLVPVFSALSRPVSAVRGIGDWFSELGNLHEENRLLKSQNAQLLQWQNVAGQLQAENTALRGLIHTVPDGKTSYVAARIVSESGGPYVRSALINGGKTSGVAANAAVVGAEGLVGRVIEPGQLSARVLLLTDINSRVPVMGEKSRERSIASGNNSDMLTLDYVPAGSELEIGERLVTSGDGGVFPSGIPVGVVTDKVNGTVTVQPLTDWTKLEYVNVVNYEF